MNVSRWAPLLFLLVPGPLLAGEPGLELLEGLWRVEGRDGAGEPTAGRLRVFRGPDGEWHYERAVRPDTVSAPHPERGLVRLERGVARLRGATGGSFRQQLAGESGGAPGLARYVPAGAEWSGERREPDGSLSAERLRRERPQDRNHVQLLVDGEAHPAMEREILAARRTIDVQTFQWADDATGRRIAEALMARAREGLRVRLLVDYATAMTNQMVSLHMQEPKVDFTGRIYRKGIRRNLRIRSSLQRELEAAGCEVIVQHKDLQGLGSSLANTGRRVLNLFRRNPPPRESRGFMNHDHRKLMIVDERVAFCGGMNIAAEYQYDWHDAQVRVEGPAAHEFHALFVDRWQAAGGEGALEPAPCEEWSGDVPVKALGSVPGLDGSIRDMYLSQIAGARERVMIEVAYFLDDHVIDALAGAVRRGVRTVVIIPSDEKNDVYLVKTAFAAVRNEVVRSGVELYFFQPTLTHAKLAVFDGERATVGSCNLDPMALNLVAEANAWIPDARFAREVERRIFEVDLPRSVRVEVREVGWLSRLWSGTLHAFRRFL